MTLKLTFDHKSTDIQNAILVNDKTLHQYTDGVDSLSEKLVDAINKLFKKSRDENHPVNSEKLARGIADKYGDDISDIVTVSVLAGAKLYGISSELRVMTVNKILNCKSVSHEIEDFMTCPYMRKYESEPDITAILTLMNYGMYLASFAETYDAMRRRRDKDHQTQSIFAEKILN